MSSSIIKLIVSSITLLHEKIMEKELSERTKYVSRVKNILGSRLNILLPQQVTLLDSGLERILKRHEWNSETITDDEIEGAYELVTEHVYPFELGLAHELMKEKNKSFR